MKKRTMTVSLMVFTLIVLATSGLRAQDKDDGDKKRFLGSGKFAIGFKTFYTWWQPGVEWDSTYALEDTYLRNFLYNPVFSIVFTEKWSLTGSFLLGRFQSNNFHRMFIVPNASIIEKGKLTGMKYDADLLVNARVRPWMKVYFGLKYVGTTMQIDMRGVFVFPNNAIPNKHGLYFPWHSAGVGVGNAFTVHLVENLYLLPNYSFLFMGALSSKSKNSGKLTVGGLGSLSFAYYIEKARLTVEAGGKVQYLYNFFISNNPTKGLSVSTEKHDLFFGPYIGLVFTF